MKKILSIFIVGVLVLSLVACQGKSKEENILKIGASPAPHGEILEQVKPILEKQGITLEIVEFTDYVLPNLAVEDGSIDGNYFQHEPYLIDFNQGNNTDLVNAGFVHYEPMGIYPGRTASLEEIKEGAKVAVPNDATNEARALLLLEANGLIKLKKGVGVEATILDIEENKYNLEIVEVEASQTPAVLKDVDFSVINSNYALQAGVEHTAIKTEDENSVAYKYANVVAVHSTKKDDERILKLIAALKSQEIKEFISSKYGSSVVVYEE